MQTITLLTRHVSLIALGPGDDRFSGLPPGGEFPRSHESVQQNEHTNGMWQTSVQDWDVTGNVQNTGIDNLYNENMDGGLYWLWDMTWNEVDR
jgi:hypothetical protein